MRWRRHLFVAGTVALLAVAAACSRFATAAGDEPEAGDGAPAEAAAPIEASATNDASPSEAGLDPIVEIAPGAYAVCARTEGGRVYCWGENTNGNAGVDPAGNAACIMNPSLGCRFAPALVDGVSGAVQLAVGSHHACALRGDGTLLCWGQNESNELGLPAADSAARFTPLVAPYISKAIEIAAGDGTGCALIADDGGTHVECWGTNQYGITGAPPVDDAGPTFTAPVVVPGLEGANHVKLSVSNTACASFPDGSLKCWGANYAGLLGDAGDGGDAYFCTTLYCTPTPQVVPGLLVSEFAVGAGFVCGISPSGAVLCAGFNGLGDLGNGAPDGLYDGVPSDVAIAGATQISADYQHVCAASQGQAYCWGANLGGALGTLDGGPDAAGACTIASGTFRCAKTPVALAGLPAVTRVYAGTASTFVLTADGVYAAGANGWGTLGRIPSPGDVGNPACEGQTTCSPVFEPIAFP